MAQRDRRKGKEIAAIVSEKKVIQSCILFIYSLCFYTYMTVGYLEGCDGLVRGHAAVAGVIVVGASLKYMFYNTTPYHLNIT
jgi:hypothetical protein